MNQRLKEQKGLVVSILLLDQPTKLIRGILKMSLCIKVLSRCFGLLSQDPGGEQDLFHSLETQIRLGEVSIDG